MATAILGPRENKDPADSQLFLAFMDGYFEKKFDSVMELGCR